LSPSPRLQQVLDAFRRHDRRAIAALVADELREGPASGDHWNNVESVANQVGEINLALEAARRYSLTEPRTLDRALHYCRALAARGRIADSLRESDALPANLQAHPSVQQLRGLLAMRSGDFAAAGAAFRSALAQVPLSGSTWQSLSLVHRFSTGDEDLRRMESLVPEIARAPRESQAAFHYALGKARHDVGEFDRAFAAYIEGAARLRAPFDAASTEAFVQGVVRDFTPDNLRQLRPSGCASDRPIFVTGLPRSGTTLVEQILASHSAVTDGEEANLFCCALMPAGDFSLRGGLEYQEHAASPDPWGDIGRDYLAMLEQRFGARGRIVDKTLNHSRFLGFVLHALPAARVIWLRRDPQDTAISCFRSFFSTGTIPWCWSLEDIAWHFKLEDRLYAHWSQVFPDRILTVPYESLVTEPTPWIVRMLAHLGLDPEPAVFAPHEQKRTVQTASVAQVREPIGTGSIGAASRYHAQLRAFRDAYSRRPQA
jgi:tetratricopeptide (TPR) repeat protein